MAEFRFAPAVAYSSQEVTGYDSLKTVTNVNKNAPKVVTLIRTHGRNDVRLMNTLMSLHPRPRPGFILWGVSHHQWQPLTLTNHSIMSVCSKLFSSIGEQFKSSFHLLSPKYWATVGLGMAPRRPLVLSKNVGACQDPKWHQSHKETKYSRYMFSVRQFQLWSLNPPPPVIFQRFLWILLRLAFTSVFIHLWKRKVCGRKRKLLWIGVIIHERAEIHQIFRLNQLLLLLQQWNLRLRCFHWFCENGYKALDPRPEDSVVRKEIN